jgi:pimeloyl-ACP methyl ester carboxylesterase
MHGTLAHSANSAPRRDGSVTLPGGRRLGYAEYGDPAGPPAIYCHGFPSSRLEAGLVPVSDVRLIAVDRPGYGLSDPRPGRRLLDFARDIEFLADELGLGRFAIAGVSGGAPYAAACAYALKDRITSCALVSGIAPPGHGWEAGSAAGALMAMGRRPFAMKAIGFGMRHVVERADPQATLKWLRVRAGFPPPAPGGLDAGELILRGWQEGLRSSMDGPLSDARIYASPWGFLPEQIEVPTVVWHGTRDRTVPVAAGRLMAARIPRAKAHILEGESHFSLIWRHHRAIMRSALGVAA